MAKFLKFLLLLVAVTAVVWLASLWRWHSRGMDPSGAELAIYLLAVPVVLTLSLVAGVWQIQKLRAFAGALLAAPTTAATTAPPPAPSPTVPDMLVLSAHAQSRLGPSWEAAQQATQSGSHPPALHARLLDGSGRPAFTAQWDELSVEDVAVSWDAFITDGAQSELAATGVTQPPDDVLRTLALLAQCLTAIQPELHEQWSVLASTGAIELDGQGQAPASPPPRVRIQIGIPARWSESWRLAVTAWVRQQLSFLILDGLKAAGQSLAMAQTPRAVVQCSVHPVEDASTFLAELTVRQQRWLAHGVPALMVIAVADSFLSQACVAQRHAQGQLPGIDTSQGRLPGEAAAALVLATPQWVAAPGYPGTPVLATMGVPQLLRRERSADQKGPPSDELGQVIETALRASGLEPAGVGSVTTDTDQRPQRQAEMLTVVEKHFSHLESSTDALCIGMGGGDVGIASWALSVALAADQVRQAKAPAMVLGNADEWQRMAWVLNIPPAQNNP